MTEPTRKLAAIMFTDIAGYTALAAHDEEKALKLIELQRDLLQPIVAEFNGEWLKEIGDGLLMSFPSSKQAVICAIKIQQTLKEIEGLNLRIGIHQGDILVKGGDVFGDDVNIASRIESFSAVGGVAITQKVQGDISSSPEFTTRYIDQPDLKGVKQKVRIYCITSHGLPETDISKVAAKLEETLVPGTPLQQAIADQTTRPMPSKKFPRKTILAVVGLIIIASGFFYFQRLGPLAEPLPVAVISFENQTGDKAFDYLRVAIPNLLITSLEQSKYMRVTTWERLHDLLKQLGKEDVEIIDKNLGFELCRLEGIKTIVLGSFIKAGDTFATDVKVLDVATKEILKSSSSRGEGVASILKTQIDQLSKEISRGIGLSESRIEAAQLPIAEVTTTSMEAYDYFLKGRINYEKVYMPDAERDLKRAITLDTTMAMAYYYLGIIYASDYFKQERDAYLERAKHFSDRVSEKERLYIESTYYLNEGNQAEALNTLEDLTRRYPQDKRAHERLGKIYQTQKMFNEAVQEYLKTLDLDPNFTPTINQLAYIYADMKDYEKAIEYLERYIRLVPGEANPYDSMGDIYAFYLGRLEAGIINYKKALEIKPNFPSSLKLSYIFALQERYDQAMYWLDYLIKHNTYTKFEPVLHIWKGFYFYWLGKYESAQNELEMTLNNIIKFDHKSLQANIELTNGWFYYDRGEFNQAHRKFKNGLEIYRKLPPEGGYHTKAFFEFSLGLTELGLGNADSLKSRLLKMTVQKEMNHQQKLDDWISYYHDYLETEYLLFKGNLEEALRRYNQLPPLGNIPMSNPEYVGRYNSPSLPDVGARIYLKMGALDKAISEYERLTHFNPPDNWRLINPRSHLILAKLYEEKGWSGKAIEQYETFLMIWKDADKGLPEILDAKERLVNLKTVRE